MIDGTCVNGTGWLYRSQKYPFLGATLDQAPSNLVFLARGSLITICKYKSGVLLSWFLTSFNSNPNQIIKIPMLFFKKSSKVTPVSKSSKSSKLSTMFKSSSSSTSKPVGKVLVIPYRSPLTMGMSRM